MTTQSTTEGVYPKFTNTEVGVRGMMSNAINIFKDKPFTTVVNNNEKINVTFGNMGDALDVAAYLILNGKLLKGLDRAIKEGRGVALLLPLSFETAFLYYVLDKLDVHQFPMNSQIGDDIMVNILQKVNDDMKALKNSKKMHLKSMQNESFDTVIVPAGRKIKHDGLNVLEFSPDDIDIQKFLNMDMEDIKKYLDIELPEINLEKYRLTFHTSGTSGKTPGVCSFNNKQIVAISQSFYRQSQKGKDYDFTNRPLLMMFPMQHMAGRHFSLEVWTSGCPIYFPPSFPCSSDDILDCVKSNGITRIYSPAVFVENLWYHCNVSKEQKEKLQQDPDGEKVLEKKQKDLEILKKVEIIVRGGGPMNEDVASEYAKISIYVANAGGMTQTGLQYCSPFMKNVPCNYMEVIDPLKDDIDFELVEGTNQYEPVIKKNSKYAWRYLQHKGEFRTGDLVSKHGKYFTIDCRMDDMIVTKNGVNISTVNLNNVLSNIEGIAGLVFGGYGERCVSILIQPKADYDQEDKKAEIRSNVLKMLRKSVGVPPSMIRFIPSDLVLPRTIKGEISQKPARELLKPVFKSLYDKFNREVQEREGSNNQSNTISPSQYALEDLCAIIINTAREIEDLSTDPINSDSNLEDFGLHSMTRIQLLNILRGKGFPVPQKFNGEAPIPIEIAKGILYGDDNKVDMAKQADKIVKKHIDRLESLMKTERPCSEAAEADKYCVWMNGTSGNLGSRMFLECLEYPSIAKVVIMFRTQKSCIEWSAKNEKLTQNEKVKTGVTGERNENLLDPVSMKEQGLYKYPPTHIMAIGWLMDFIRNLEEFDSCFEGLVNLLNFGRGTEFLYASSISAWMKSISGDPIPETISYDPTLAAQNGYGLSNFIAEQLVDYAHTIGLVKSVIPRIGQLAQDSVTRDWNSKDMFHRIIKSSLIMGKVPDLKIRTDFIPIDMAAKIIMEIFLDPNTNGGVFNISHTNPGDWNQTVIEHQPQQESYPKWEKVSLEEWEKAAELYNEEHPKDPLPIGPLLPLLKDLVTDNAFPKYDNVKAMTHSDTFRNLSFWDSSSISN